MWPILLADVMYWWYRCQSGYLALWHIAHCQTSFKSHPVHIRVEQPHLGWLATSGLSDSPLPVARDSCWPTSTWAPGRTPRCGPYLGHTALRIFLLTEILFLELRVGLRMKRELVQYGEAWVGRAGWGVLLLLAHQSLSFRHDVYLGCLLGFYILTTYWAPWPNR